MHIFVYLGVYLQLVPHYINKMVKNCESTNIFVNSMQHYGKLYS